MDYKLHQKHLQPYVGFLLMLMLMLSRSPSEIKSMSMITSKAPTFLLALSPILRTPQ